jgi:hypothetical protein
VGTVGRGRVGGVELAVGALVGLAASCWAASETTTASGQHRSALALGVIKVWMGLP